ncbi:hypothetical protein [Neisseria gonorrhoeae]|nr:hypothetical protein [Pelomonas sp. Root1444]
MAARRAKGRKRLAV